MATGEEASILNTISRRSIVSVVGFMDSRVRGNDILNGTVFLMFYKPICVSVPFLADIQTR